MLISEVFNYPWDLKKFKFIETLPCKYTKQTDSINGNKTKRFSVKAVSNPAVKPRNDFFFNGLHLVKCLPNNMAAVLEQNLCRLARLKHDWLLFKVPLGPGRRIITHLPASLTTPLDLIAKRSHRPGIQLECLNKLFEWALAGILCTLTSGKWSQWGSVATAWAATEDFLPARQQRNLSPQQF